MSAYAELPKAVQDVVDRQAERMARNVGISVEEARENIARRVRTLKTVRPTHGTGH